MARTAIKLVLLQLQKPQRKRNDVNLSDVRSDGPPLGLPRLLQNGFNVDEVPSECSNCSSREMLVWFAPKIPQHVKDRLNHLMDLRLFKAFSDVRRELGHDEEERLG